MVSSLKFVVIITTFALLLILFRKPGFFVQETRFLCTTSTDSGLTIKLTAPLARAERVRQESDLSSTPTPLKKGDGRGL